MNLSYDKASKLLIVQAEPGLTELDFRLVAYKSSKPVEDISIDFYLQEENTEFGFSGLNLFDSISAVNGNTITFSNTYSFFIDSLGTYLDTGNNLSLIVASTNNSLTLKELLGEPTKALFRGFIANLYYFKLDKYADYVEVINLKTKELGNSLFASQQIEIDLSGITSMQTEILAKLNNIDFSQLQEEHQEILTAIEEVNTSVNNIGTTIAGSDYLTALDIQPLFDNQYTVKVFQ